MTWLFLCIGLVLLLGGGEALVNGSVGVARRFRVSPLVIGLTLVGFGTSTPELVASLEAAMIGAPGIAIGNVVGSNIANILLILGVSAVILPVTTSRKAFTRDGLVLMMASVLLVILCMVGTIGRTTGAVFVVLLAAYTLYTYLSERKQAAPEPAADEPADRPLAVSALLAVGGIAGVVVGAGFLVDASVELARRFGMSEAVIGLTLVAVGTSLPELVTSVMAAIRRHGDVAFGNIVGSNIFNILGIAGVTGLVSPIPIPEEIIRFDAWIMLASALALVAFAVTGWRINRWEGGLLLAAYAAYLVLQLSPPVRQAIGLS
ncbi:calcium/sodium antiporter [Amorphus orientalis]|uniref:Cation:H+ antiporter n=1 Tax=Amorphus orientalis TaxID=649198 RepID=A0AAE4AV61_9HYPH|nr:calcium/sodium antiporter [Amorphus orientalis]MDQ0316379.1 cation:H+ antiporter [Amorphus orientalis]